MINWPTNWTVIDTETGEVVGRVWAKTYMEAKALALKTFPQLYSNRVNLRKEGE